MGVVGSQKQIFLNSFILRWKLFVFLSLRYLAYLLCFNTFKKFVWIYFKHLIGFCFKLSSCYYVATKQVSFILKNLYLWLHLIKHNTSCQKQQFYIELKIQTLYLATKRLKLLSIFKGASIKSGVTNQKEKREHKHKTNFQIQKK